MRLIHTVSQAFRKFVSFLTSILRFVGTVGKGCTKVADTLEETARKEPANGEINLERSGTLNNIHECQGTRGGMDECMSHSIHESRVSVQRQHQSSVTHKRSGSSHPHHHIKVKDDSEIKIYEAVEISSGSGGEHR